MRHVFTEHKILRADAMKFFHSFFKTYLTVLTFCVILYVYKLQDGPCDVTVCSLLPYRVDHLVILNLIFDRPK
jgi:hypothetical protein